MCACRGSHFRNVVDAYVAKCKLRQLCQSESVFFTGCCDTFPFNVKYSPTNYTCRQNDHFRTPQFSANAVKHQLVFLAFTSWSGKNHDNLIKECSFVTILGQNVFLIIRKLVENQVHCTRISGVYSSNTHLNSQIPLKLSKLRD